MGKVLRRLVHGAGLGLASVLVCAGVAGSSPQAIPVPDLFVMNADGSGMVNVTNSATWDSSATWSPDGTKIAYARDDQIVVANADGSNPIPLTHTGFNRYPAWSPDGKRIVFSGGRASSGGYQQSFDIWVANLASGSLLNLTRNSGADDLTPSWSPNGKGIVFASGTGNDTDLCTMGADGGNRKRLTSSPEIDIDPSWSPDGSRILFARHYRASAELWASDLWVIGAASSAATALTQDLNADYNPSWSPDGTRIVFARNPIVEPFDLDIWVMNADGSGLVDLGADTHWYDGGPAWSPDGQRIVFERSDLRFGPFPAPAPSGGAPPCGPPPPPPPAVRCTVPRVVGLRLAKARSRIRRARCAVGRVRRARSSRVGRVLVQKPRAGRILARGGKVRLVVGRR